MAELELLHQRIAVLERRGRRWQWWTLAALVVAAVSVTLQVRSTATSQPRDHVVFENAQSKVEIDANGIALTRRGSNVERTLTLHPGQLWVRGDHAELRLDGPGATVSVDAPDGAVAVGSTLKRTELGAGSLSIKMDDTDYLVAKNGFSLTSRNWKGRIAARTDTKVTSLDVEGDGGSNGAVSASLSAWHTHDASLLLTSSDLAAARSNTSMLFVNRRGASVDVQAFDGATRSLSAGAPHSADSTIRSP